MVKAWQQELAVSPSPTSLRFQQAVQEQELEALASRPVSRPYPSSQPPQRYAVVQVSFA